MEFIKILERAFYKVNWNIAYRELDDRESVDYKFNHLRKYQKANMAKGTWGADPFVFDYEGKSYIFCEYVLEKEDKGKIAVAEYNHHKLGEMKVIIENDYHMSYPCVFEYENKIFMIPETSQNKTIELYEATKFPYEWQLVKTMKKDINIVDATVFFNDKDIYLLGFIDDSDNIGIVYKLDLEKFILVPASIGEISCFYRPAGSLVYNDKELYRPTQMFERRYGENVKFMKVLSFNDYEFKEVESHEINKDNIKVDGVGKIDRVHTFNQSKKLEVIDYSIDNLDIFKPLRYFIRKFK